MSGSSWTRRWITCLGLSCLLVGERALAQVPTRPHLEGGTGRWALVDAMGYGGVGFMAGLAAAWDADIGEGFATVGLGTLAGVVTGAAIGGHASSRIRNGEQPGGVSRFLASAGAVLGGATLGACAAVPLINGEGAGTSLGSDESTLAVLMGGGTLLGVWYLYRHNSDFDGPRLGISPIRTRDSAYGLRVAMRF